MLLSTLLKQCAIVNISRVCHCQLFSSVQLSTFLKCVIVNFSRVCYCQLFSSSVLFLNVNFSRVVHCLPFSIVLLLTFFEYAIVNFSQLCHCQLFWLCYCQLFSSVLLLTFLKCVFVCLQCIQLDPNTHQLLSRLVLLLINNDYLLTRGEERLISCLNNYAAQLSANQLLILNS